VFLDNIAISASHKKFLSKVGLDQKPQKPECQQYLKRTAKRSTSDIHSFQVPPNIYNTTYRPYSSLAGAGGAYWHKKNFDKEYAANRHPKKDDSKFYNVPGCLDHVFSRHANYRGRLGKGKNLNLSYTCLSVCRSL